MNLPVDGPQGDISDRADVVIVGAGPVGLLAAHLLGAASVEVLIVDKQLKTSAMPKAIVVDDEHLRALDRLGLQAAVDPDARPFGIHFLTAVGNPIVQASGFITANGRGNRNPISQPVYEKTLLLDLRKYPSVSVRYGADVLGIEQDADGVRVLMKTSHGGEKAVAADFLMGCDGTASTVRKGLKIPFAGRRIDQPHLVVDLADFPDQSPYSRFFCNPERPFNSVPGPYGGRRIEFMLMPGDDPVDICRHDEVRKLIDRHTPYAGLPLRILRTAVYGFSERVAERLSEGRCFLLGDAAHVMPPFGAQGLNTGARDAVNLCWKIKGALVGKWSASVLHSYDLERKPQIEQTIAYSVRVGRLANIQSRPLAGMRNLLFTLLNKIPAIRAYFGEMRYMPKPRIRDGLLLDDEHGKRSFAGMLFPRIEGLGVGEDRNFDELTGENFALVGIGADDKLLKVVAAQEPWRRLDVSVVPLEVQVFSPRGGDAMTMRLRSLYAVHHDEVLIVRPDKYIAGSMNRRNYAEQSRQFDALLSPEQSAYRQDV